MKCPDCNKEISYRAHRCRSCHVKNMHKTGALINKTGEKSHRWKGGRITTAAGYVAVLKPNHSRADRNGYVLEHILVWETTHGKPLPKGWVVHHLNGIKNDNRPSNLIGLPSKKHYLLLEAKAKRIQELEALLKAQGQLF